MKIEKHNAHGLNLDLNFSRNEAIQFANGLLASISESDKTKNNTGFLFNCLFEDDNDRYDPCLLGITIEGEYRHSDFYAIQMNSVNWHDAPYEKRPKPLNEKDNP